MTDMVVYLTIKYIYRSSLKYQIYTIECVKEFGTDKKCAIIQIPGILFYELVCTPHKHTCPPHHSLIPLKFQSVQVLDYFCIIHLMSNLTDRAEMTSTLLRISTNGAVHKMLFILEHTCIKGKPRFKSSNL